MSEKYSLIWSLQLDYLKNAIVINNHDDSYSKIDKSNAGTVGK